MPRASQTPPPTDTAAASRHVWAGTSGWAYPTWKPDFYPARTPAKNFLAFYASQLTSVEVNYTFRALPTAKMLEDWLAATPDRFRFTFKMPQRITHIKRLCECSDDIARFISTIEPVRQAGKLGLLLVQLPPNFKADAALLEEFLRIQAFQASGTTPVAFEFRHASWFSDEIYAVLRRHDAALCIAESDDLATPEVHTSSTCTSFRLRRTAGYTSAELAALAQRFSTLAGQRDVYVYFKHEDDPSGALNAVALLSQIRPGAHEE